MKKHIPNKLAERLDGLDQAPGFDAGKLWGKLENSLVRRQQQRRRQRRLCAAAVLLALISFIGVRLITASKTIVAENNQPETVLVNATPATATVPNITHKEIPAVIKNKEPQQPATNQVILGKPVLHESLRSTPPSERQDTVELSAATPDTVESSTASLPPPVAKKHLKVMHINDILYENGQRAREEYLYRNAPYTHSGNEPSMLELTEEQSKPGSKKLLQRLTTAKSYNN